nr:NHL domain-containing thioredoxin family protein [Saccharomonospora iraqiensis]
MVFTGGVSAAKNRAPVRAPELTGDVWFNTGDRPLTLSALRGRVVLLDFWTSGCVNCLHVLDELRPLEREFADVLVTIGVHSPKFAREGEAESVAAAVARYGVDHPVVSDPDMRLWQEYTVKAWPTLVVVDPEGYVAHVAAGEGHADALRTVIRDLVAGHEAAGTLRRGDDPLAEALDRAGPAGRTDQEEGRDEQGGRDRATGVPLRFPSKAVATAEGRVLVADTAHHSVVEFASDAETVVRRFGDGERGAADGAFDVATFAEPAGLTLLPPEVAERVGYHLLVADTGNHLLRGIDLRTGSVRTVAGTGAQWRDGADSGPATGSALTSPWDVRWWEPAGGVVVAMAGNHTLSLFDPVRGEIRRFAGTTVEGLRDGAAAEAFFAQTSGLAVAGERLWLVDAETSALRRVDPTDGPDADGDGAADADADGDGRDRFVVRTEVGVDLFTFGHRDGDAAQALLQHPTGLSVLPDGGIAVADTYNGAVRRFDPDTGQVTTLMRDLAEPTDVLVTDTGVFVVESAAHRLRALHRASPAGSSATAGADDGDGQGAGGPDDGGEGTDGERVDGEAMLVRRPPTELAPGEVRLSVVFTPPEGETMDDRYGPSTRLEVSASPPELLVDGGGQGTDLQRTVTLADDHPEGVLQVVAQAASCATDAEHPVCRITRQDWGVPVRVNPAGAGELPLVMAGTPEEPTGGA